MPDGFDRRRFPHECVFASAGSGKTYELSSRYVKLVAAGAGIGSILASTFTRAAAGEIRDRILFRLAEAADDESKRRELARSIDRSALSRADVIEILVGLVRQLHRMQIRTLDSFFGSVVRSFALELDLPPASEIVEAAPAADLRAEAIGQMLESEGTERLLPLLRRLTQGRSSRAVMSTIDSVVQSLHGLYREAPREAWDWIEPAPELDRSALAAAFERLARCRPETPPSHADAFDEDLAKASRGAWDAFLKSGLAKAIATSAGDEVTYRRASLDPALIDAYRPLVEHARAALVNEVRWQTHATRELLALYDEHYRDVRRRRRALTFDDITDAMTRVDRVGELEEIYYRLDGQIDHLLLDEFQDTSIRQWRALERIAGELVSDESLPRTFFCVGDVKQSIYGWRGACPEVLEEVPRLLAAPDGGSFIRQRTLSRSWRSSQVVIDAVNEVFESLETNAALQDHPKAASQFARAFETHRTAKDLPGFVELSACRDAGDGECAETIRFETAAARIRELYEAAPGLRIGVLARTNAAVSRILFELTRGEDPIPASGLGGGPLIDSPAVNAVLDLLRLADHPDDTVSAFNVARGPLGALLGFTDERAEARRHAVARQVRRELVDHGYAETIARWTGGLAPQCDDRQYGRLRRLVELATEREALATLRADDFVRFVEARDVSEVATAPVQVLTIHQSKGLEFDIVVLPELDGALRGRGQPPAITERTGEVGPICRISRWAPDVVQEAVPDLERLVAAHRTRTARESLAVLYVAMTRARQGLLMLIDPPRVKKDGEVRLVDLKTPAGLLWSALSKNGPPKGGARIYDEGKRDWMERTGRAPRREVAPPVSRPRPIVLAAGAGTVCRGAVMTPASSVAGEASRLGEELELRDPEPRDRGSAVHRLFEQIEWMETFVADETALDRLVSLEAPRRSEAWRREVIAIFLAALERSDVRAALSRGPGAQRVWRERPFVRLVGGRVQQGIIDRVTVDLDASGAVQRATIVDFKTDDVTAAAAEAHAERYRGQLRTYRAAVARMHGLDETRIEMIVLFVRPGAAVTLAEPPSARAGGAAPAPG